MNTDLELVDLGKATEETKINTINPVYYDGTGYQYWNLEE